MDIGEVETSGKDKSRQPGPGKSRSLKEATRSEGAAEGASKPVRGWGAALVGQPVPLPLPTGSSHVSVLSWDRKGSGVAERGTVRLIHSVLGKSHPFQLQQAWENSWH